MDDAKKSIRELAWPIVASVISSLVVGLVASYMTAHEMIARFDERIAMIEREVEIAKTEREASRSGERLLSERLIRLETKIDILLDVKRAP